MNSDVQIRLLRAVHACMRPIARILLRSGITYRQFADIAKLAFVQEAFSEPERSGAKTNISRVAVQTGMSRKDVARVEASFGGSKGEDSEGATDHSGPPSRVLHEWHTNPRFMDKGGHPAELQIEGDDPSFAGLVSHVTGDVPSRCDQGRAAALGRSGGNSEGQDQAIEALLCARGRGREGINGHFPNALSIGIWIGTQLKSEQERLTASSSASL